MGINFFISIVSSTNVSWHSTLFLSWPKKHPLRMKVREEIGRVGRGEGLRGRPTTITLHFPFVNLLSYFHFFIIF
jgi:hypothetical protein